MDSSNARKFEGTGLGLNIAKRIIEAHEGKLDFVSKLGVGSTFFIDLHEEAAPIEDENARDDAEPEIRAIA